MCDLNLLLLCVLLMCVAESWLLWLMLVLAPCFCVNWLMCCLEWMALWMCEMCECDLCLCWMWWFPLDPVFFAECVLCVSNVVPVYFCVCVVKMCLCEVLEPACLMSVWCVVLCCVLHVIFLLIGSLCCVDWGTFVGFVCLSLCEWWCVVCVFEHWLWLNVWIWFVSFVWMGIGMYLFVVCRCCCVCLVCFLPCLVVEIDVVVVVSVLSLLSDEQTCCFGGAVLSDGVGVCLFCVCAM